MKKKQKILIPCIAAAVALAIGGVALFGGDPSLPSDADNAPSGNNTAPGNSAPSVPPNPGTAPEFGEGDALQVRPPDVTITNYTPGRDASHDIEIYNGKDEPRTYTIEYRVSERRRPEYEAPPENAGQWVIIDPSSITIGPKQTQAVTVTLRIPAGTTVDVERWEFRVYVVEVTGAQFEVEIGTRWLVRMA